MAREAGPALVEAVVSGDLEALPRRMRLLCGYALKLTVSPWETTEADVLALREGDLSDRDIVDANQVVAYFNYVAEGLGVELEDYWSAGSRRTRTYRTGRWSIQGDLG